MVPTEPECSPKVPGGFSSPLDGQTPLPLAIRVSSLFCLVLAGPPQFEVGGETVSATSWFKGVSLSVVVLESGLLLDSGGGESSFSAISGGDSWEVDSKLGFSIAMALVDAMYAAINRKRIRIAGARNWAKKHIIGMFSDQARMTKLIALTYRTILLVGFFSNGSLLRMI